MRVGFCLFSECRKNGCCATSGKSLGNKKIQPFFKLPLDFFISQFVMGASPKPPTIRKDFKIGGRSVRSKRRRRSRFFLFSASAFHSPPPPRLWSGEVRVFKFLLHSFFAGSGKKKKRKRSHSLLFFLFFLDRQPLLSSPQTPWRWCVGEVVASLLARKLAPSIPP